MKRQDKILFSKYYEIKEDPKKFDFLDIYLNADSKFFLDAAKIKYESTREGEYQYLFIRMQNKIDHFFESVLHLYQSLGVDGELDLEANKDAFKRFFNNSGETQATHIGYGKVGSPGKGNSFEILKDAFDYVHVERLHELGVLENAEELTLFTENFDYDRMSDFIISLIIPELAEFTLLQGEKHNVSDNYLSKKPIRLGDVWDIESGEWQPFREKAYFDHVGKPVLLIPRCIISRTYLYDSKKYLSHSLYRRQDEYTKMESELNVVTEDGVKPPSHKTIKEVEIQAPGLSTKVYLINRTLTDKDLRGSFKRNISHVVANGSAVLSADEIDAYRLADSREEK